MASDMNQNDLSFKSDQQMEELQGLFPSSQPSDLSFDHLQQQQQVEDEVTTGIKEMTKDCGDGLLLPECCIYRVPITLHHLKKEAYTPKLISIGPFHYGKERLKDMERHKHILFIRFTQRTSSSLDDLVCFVKPLLPKVRASYSETIELTEQKLVELTLMDAGFIIELFISILVGERTEFYFGNMIALEQCHYPYHTYITDYIVMLDYLVDTSKDVDLLVRNEIVTNWLGDTNKVALLFNGLALNAIQVNFNSEYWNICKRLNGYCRGRWHKMKATLRRDYCRTLWQIVASTAAIVLLLLTVAQTILSVLQVVNT